MEEIWVRSGFAPDAVAPEQTEQISVQAEPSLPMMSVYIPMMIASSLATAGSIGLFERLADGPMGVHELASTLDMSVDGLGRLTDFLVAAGYLQRSGPAVANTPGTTRWFTSRGDVDYAPGLTWTADAWRIMEDLPAAVTRGGPKQLLWERMSADPDLGTRFSRYMRAFAEHLSPDLIASIALPRGARRLLDLGGSHGKHSMEFCRAYPDVHAVIVDQSSALTQTEAEIEAAGLSDRISIRSGDVRDCNWGAGYDVVLYLSIAHNMTLSENRAIFQNLATVMRAGGLLIIHDYPRETTPELFETAFRLTLLVETGTRTFTYKEFTDILSESGFSQVQIKALSPAEKGALIIARR